MSLFSENKNDFRVVAQKPQAVSSSSRWVIRDNSTIYFKGSDAQCNHHLAQLKRIYGENLRVEKYEG